MSQTEVNVSRCLMLLVSWLFWPASFIAGKNEAKDLIRFATDAFFIVVEITALGSLKDNLIQGNNDECREFNFHLLCVVIFLALW